MTAAIAKYAAQKMLSKEMDKYKDRKPEGSYDPYYEMIPHPRKPGKSKKVKKQIPAYIPEHDANILARARKTAYHLDFALFNFMGLRFGWASVIGIVPLVGDGADAFLAFVLILHMLKIEDGLPKKIFARMMLNLVVDFTIGLVPVVGDLVDAAVKCNGRNVRLLENHLDRKYKPEAIQEAESKLPANKRPRPATIYEDFSDEEDTRRGTFDDRHDDVRQPTRAYSGRKERVPDEEMGLPRQDTHRSHKEKPGRRGTNSSRRH
ncbi:hypothetical protein P280DRAFT_473157 [Massarina eburnea CBS 473.64]|uniref:PH domain-containing protein n=1 Tax=Massarina eburnea CBS 473.64 TaxID=1395130 RepID=A0A6A6RP95_9PLEO|nr:hypothetical protein P280DRAFT_473157 [Massarina eburnea CBS 473.64]